MKKYFILALCAILSVSMITGCGSKKEDKKEETKTETSEENKGSSKVIYFYGTKDDIGYYIESDYSEPSNKNDIVAKYECDTDECTVIDLPSNKIRTSSYDNLFNKAIIQEKDYYSFFDGENKIKLSISVSEDGIDVYPSTYNDTVLFLGTSDSDLKAIYSVKANKVISEYKYSALYSVPIPVGNYIYIILQDKTQNDSLDIYEVTTGKQITEGKEYELIKYLYKFLDAHTSFSMREPYNFNISYIKENGLTNEVYFDSSMEYGSIGNQNAKWLSQQQPSADDCSLTDKNGKEYKCNELVLYDFDAVDASVYYFFGKHLDKKDCYDSNNNKYCVYVNSINALGFITKPNIMSTYNDTRSAVISYKIDGNNADVKFAYMKYDDIKNNTFCSAKGESKCMQYVLDNYSDTYTLHLIWDNDHYYIDSITFGK